MKTDKFKAGDMVYQIGDNPVIKNPFKITHWDKDGYIEVIGFGKVHIDNFRKTDTFFRMRRSQFKSYLTKVNAVSVEFEYVDNSKMGSYEFYVTTESEDGTRKRICIAYQDKKSYEATEQDLRIKYEIWAKQVNRTMKII